MRLEQWSKLMEEKFNASTLKLGHNLRNTQNIVNTSKAVNKNPLEHESEFLIPEKILSGPNNYYYKNEEDFDKRILIEAVVSKHFSEDPKEPVIVFTRQDAEIIYEWCKHYLSRKVTYISEKGNHDYSQVEEYLKHPEGVLITEPQTFRGAQARNTIYFVDFGDEIRNIILRSMSFTYIIDNRGRKKGIDNNCWIPGLVEDKDLAKSIQYKPSAFQFQNRMNVAEHILVDAMINELFANNPEETIGVCVAVEKLQEVFEHLKLRFSGARNVEKHFSKKCDICVNDSYNYDHLCDNFKNIIIYLKTYGADELEDLEKYSRNLILLARKTKFILVHQGDISKFTPYVQMEELRLESFKET